jgi:tRNA uridine 5-carboxymethylaminomethyl modification enzyme
MGFKIERFQTATPPRVDRRTLDLSKTAVQYGDDQYLSFSFWDKEKIYESVKCYLTYTNDKTHNIIEENIEKSPIRSGMVDTHGPRHCPSIDRKVINFPEKKRHPVFIEPEGIRTNEMYLQGLTTSMPMEVQEKIVNSVRGLERARIIRPGYAVEYDYIIPNQLDLTLESKTVKNLYFAGQINGTSGYEEAAAQGLVAGINAALKVKGKSPLILTRDNSYIGVLIDDLLTKKLIEPYRMYTSRAEYRLVLRSDNADIRLSRYGNKIGLITDEQIRKVAERENEINRLILKLKEGSIKPGRSSDPILKKMGIRPVSTHLSAYRLLKRPEIKIEDIINFIGGRADNYKRRVLKQAEVNIKYEGYITRQLSEIKKLKSLERYSLPKDLDYFSIVGLTYEAQEKLSNIRPDTLGQASRIAGISPADISILMLNLKAKLRTGV